MPTKRKQDRQVAVDERMMRRAVSLARRGEGRVEPNPMVGCVLARGDRVIAEGYHRRFGGPHAEIDALRRCPIDPAGLSVYVTLEPCCHRGKTPPCTTALIDARVGRVVISLRDPNPLVSGKGIRRLRAAGIEISTGVLGGETAELLAPYLTRLLLGRPYVIAKWAQSLDGKLATAGGDSRWISCEASRRLVHRLRARVDAILIGSGTVLADDPLLTAREVPIRRSAIRVILDGRLQLPEKCRIVDTASTHSTLVLTTTSRAKSPKASRLRRRGVEVVTCRARGGRLVLQDCLTKLAQRDVTNLLAEGGPIVLTALLEANLVDEAHVFTAPILIGGDKAPTALGGRGASRVDLATSARVVHTRRVGRDVLHRIRLSEPPAR